MDPPNAYLAIGLSDYDYRDLSDEHIVTAYYKYTVPSSDMYWEHADKALKVIAESRNSRFLRFIIDGGKRPTPNERLRQMPFTKNKCEGRVRF